MRANLFADVEAVMTVRRVLLPELYEKILVDDEGIAKVMTGA